VRQSFVLLPTAPLVSTSPSDDCMSATTIDAECVGIQDIVIEVYQDPDA
jgi:hypothetical protein